MAMPSASVLSERQLDALRHLAFCESGDFLLEKLREVLKEASQLRRLKNKEGASRWRSAEFQSGSSMRPGMTCDEHKNRGGGNSTCCE
jgi:hypothetical protein